MKKRIVASVLCLAMSLSLVGVGAFAVEDANAAAEALHELGLFSGTGTDANGNPIYDLERTPTRNEAVTMLVRLLGKEEEAKAGNWETPFTDVDEWAKPYVGYAYANKLTTGTSETTFGGTATVSPSQYLTFVLRALGYQSGSDFQWDKAWELSDQLGITHGEYGPDSTFSRGDVALISHSSLSAPLKEGGKILLEELWLKDHGHEKPPVPTETPTPTPTPTPSSPVDLELKNDGGSTGIDPQKPVESAPPISEIEIPSGKGLQLGESDEGLTPAGTPYQYSSDVYTIESERYVQLSDKIIGTVKSEYLEDDERTDGYFRRNRVDFVLYVGESITLNSEDYGAPAATAYWVIDSDSYIASHDNGDGTFTITAKKAKENSCIGALHTEFGNYNGYTDFFVSIYDKRPANMTANFYLDTQYERTYYSSPADGINATNAHYWYTDKGATFNGTNGYEGFTIIQGAFDTVLVYPDASAGIPASALTKEGYVKPEEVNKYYQFSTSDPYGQKLIVSDIGGNISLFALTSDMENRVVTVTVTSLKDGRSCSIDFALKYYKP